MAVAVTVELVMAVASAYSLGQGRRKGIRGGLKATSTVRDAETETERDAEASMQINVNLILL